MTHGTSSKVAGELDFEESLVQEIGVPYRVVNSGADVTVDDPPAQGFARATGVFNNWSFWQYSDTGNSGGISPLDLDVCHSEYKPLSSYRIPGASPSR